MTLDNISNEEQNELLVLLTQILDPRKKRGIRYKLQDLILLSIYSILSGMFDAVDMHFYVEYNFEYFNKLLGIKSVPSHDTFSRILRMVDYEMLSDKLSEWLNKYYPEQIKKYNNMQVAHIDGKAVKAAAKKSEGEKSVYLLNAMYEGGSISLKSKKIGEKENEITCLPSFLDTLNLENCIVTIDAIGCNKTIINKIIEKKGHFVIPVKDNQKKLLESIKKEIERLKKENEYEQLEQAENILKDHGRVEKYQSHLISNTKFIYEELKNASFYGEIGKICVIEKTTIKKENGEVQKTTKISYVITDLEDILCEDMLHIKISHWNIESKHYLLDVVLREDYCTMRKDNAMINASILRKFCMKVQNGERVEPKKKLVLKRFLLRNGFNPENVSKLLFIDIAKANS